MTENMTLVVVRTYSAGVHIGLADLSRWGGGRRIKLHDSRRLWRWRGANTLNEVALHGVDQDYTRISERVPLIHLTEAIEVIPVAPGAAENLTESRWGR